MALMYPWATKEYVLWQMTWGQVSLYLRYGYEISNGIEGPYGLAGMTKEELLNFREEVMGPIEEANREALKARYGEVEG